MDVRVEKVMIPQTPTHSEPRWFVDVRTGDGVVRDGSNFDNESDALNYADQLRRTPAPTEPTP